MTVSSIVPVNTYTGNSTVKKFDFDFLIESENELIVQHISEDNVITKLILGVDYSINEIGNQNGSYIIFPLETSSYNILKENEKITLMLTLTIKQESEFKNSSYFNLNILEWTFDYIVRILQILNRKVERSIKVNEGSDILPDELVKNLFNAEANAKISETNAKQSETNAKASETATAQLKNETNQIKQDTQNIADKALQDISTAKTSAIGEINTTKTSAIVSVNSTKDLANASVNATKDQAVQEVQTEGSRQKAQMQDYVDIAKDWANKTDGTVDGTEYSAKYYAEKSKSHSAVTYKQLMASPGYARGEVSDDTEGYQNVLSYAHSTFDLSKFNVVGSPTITEDGVASGFSSGNYVNLGKYSIKNDLQIKCNSNNVNLTGTNRGAILSWYQNEQNYFRLFWYSNTQLRFDYFKQGETTATANTFNCNSNDNYIFDIIYENNQISLFKDGEIIHTYNGTINLTALNLVNGQLGVQTIGNWYLENGSIDLKSFAIWADGVPVFNGNKTGTDKINEIEIPYTLSNNGSKIVDVAYRDRVQDLYEQTGEALYYTIDEQNQNFTLPMGEVYGMITSLQDNSVNTSLTNLTNGLANVICTTVPTTASTASAQRPAVVIENYVNGTSGYYVRSDGYCEQWGEANWTSTVSLLKTYVDTNYSIVCTQLTTSSWVENVKVTQKNTSSFVLNGGNSGNYVMWRTYGYIK